MKIQKIYSRFKPQESVCYYLELEDNDVVDNSCKLKFGDSFLRFDSDSKFLGKTLKEAREWCWKDGINAEVKIFKCFDNF